MPGEKKKLPKEVFTQMAALLLGGFSFVAALAWNDAVQSLLARFFDPKEAGLMLKFIYAAVVTLVLTFISIRFSRYMSDDKK